ncbi:hypothetical protein TNCV_756441 [Trichonephila clavipes]|nr:hypothetical protein TNCV_756441 [Trichonephila clavipes]
MFRTLKELKKHYEVSHDEIELKQEEHVFNTDESFQKGRRGSVKCGKTCPAFMTAIREQKEEAIKITVQYQSVHAGHENAENIQKKWPPTERLGLLTKRDLHNVSRDFEVDESILHAEDAVSVDLQKKNAKGLLQSCFDL